MSRPGAFARRLRRFLRRDEGAISVEFVVIFPLILLFLFLIVFVSLLIATASDVQQVAHELARHSIRLLNQAAPPADICQTMAADSRLIGGLLRQSVLLNPADLTVLSCPSMPDANGFITVTVTYNFAGSFVQALGQNFGVDLGLITRISSTRL